jgi:hypothetical protein
MFFAAGAECFIDHIHHAFHDFTIKTPARTHVLPQPHQKSARKT